MTTPAQEKARYRRMINQVGETITLRRYTSVGTSRTKIDRSVRARVTGYDERDLGGTIQQGDRKIIVLAEDVDVNSDSPPTPLLPLTPADKVVVRGRELAIISVDDNTRRLAGELIALEIQGRG